VREGVQTQLLTVPCTWAPWRRLPESSSACAHPHAHRVTPRSVARRVAQCRTLPRTKAASSELIIMLSVCGGLRERRRTGLRSRSIGLRSRSRSRLRLRLILGSSAFLRHTPLRRRRERHKRPWRGVNYHTALLRAAAASAMRAPNRVPARILAFALTCVTLAGGEDRGARGAFGSRCLHLAISTSP
jgi:hypothetical protein